MAIDNIHDATARRRCRRPSALPRPRVWRRTRRRPAAKKAAAHKEAVELASTYESCVRMAAKCGEEDGCKCGEEDGCKCGEEDGCKCGD
jgi:hypothetical protein